MSIKLPTQSPHNVTQNYRLLRVSPVNRFPRGAHKCSPKNRRAVCVWLLPWTRPVLPLSNVSKPRRLINFGRSKLRFSFSSYCKIPSAIQKSIQYLAEKIAAIELSIQSLWYSYGFSMAHGSPAVIHPYLELHAHWSFTFALDNPEFLSKGTSESLCTKQRLRSFAMYTNIHTVHMAWEDLLPRLWSLCSNVLGDGLDMRH